MSFGVKMSEISIEQDQDMIEGLFSDIFYNNLRINPEGDYDNISGVILVKPNELTDFQMKYQI